MAFWSLIYETKIGDFSMKKLFFYKSYAYIKKSLYICV